MTADDRRISRADLVVIGAGSAGLSVAAGAAQLGLKVVLYEKAEMGGDCLNDGCVPSKALIAAARAAQAHRDSARFGVAADEPTVDWPAVRRHIRGVIEAIAPIDSQERFEGLGVRVVREAARFADPRTVVSDTTCVRARRIVIATGSRPAAPSTPGLDGVDYLTNETVFDIDALPARLIVLGAGPIGMELAQAFRRLGAAVTVVEAQTPLARADPEAAQAVSAALTQEGVEILAGWSATAAAKTADGVALTIEAKDGQRRILQAERLLVATGRRAALDGLDLAKGQIAHTARGVTTDAGLRTSNPRVWALGDAAGREQFTHAAGQHASVWVRRALFKQSTLAHSLPIPEVTYTDPELAQVGLGEETARARFGSRVRVTRWTFHDNDRAQAERDTQGFAKLVLHANGQILGATIVGAGAGDLLQSVTLAMSNGLNARALTNFVAPYPTRGEIVKRLAGAFYSPVLFSPSTRRLVGLLQRLP